MFARICGTADMHHVLLQVVDEAERVELRCDSVGDAEPFVSLRKRIEREAAEGQDIEHGPIDRNETMLL